jgi:hypothetical protein
MSRVTEVMIVSVPFMVLVVVGLGVPVDQSMS